MTRCLPRSLKAGKTALSAVLALALGCSFLRAENATASLEQVASVLAKSATTAEALAKAASNLPDLERMRTTRAALSIVLLTRFDRLLPKLPPTELDRLADIILAENPDPAEQSAAVAKLPPADQVVFDGAQLAGGNFRNIDTLVGLGGRPIALDRELPAWIVPLEPSRAQALESTRGAGWSPHKFAELQNLFNRIHSADVGEHLVSDGIFLRPYAGRLDDLYHHLVQKGGRAGQLDYFALLDSLPPRQYSPVSGTGTRKSVPPLRVNLSNVLSGGSFMAMQNFKAENPRANLPNRFQKFAVRILPYLSEQIRKTAPGSDLKISGDLMLRAMGDTRRFSPGKVPPLFVDPSRFLGQWDDPRFIRVGKKKKTSNAALFAEIQKVDFETPLPEMPFEPAGNALLGKPQADAPPDNDLLEDLGLPPQSRETATYEPPETPAPVLPPSRITEPEAPAPSPVLAKPEPPPLEVHPLEFPPVFDFAQAPTPESIASSPPTPAPAVEEQPATPTPDPTAPTPPPKPSAIAVIPMQEPTATPRPEQPATPAPPREPQVAKAIPVNPPEDTLQRQPGSLTTPYQVAVLTPTANEAIDYWKKIAASDIALGDNLASTRRADCVIRWLGEAAKPFEPLLTQTPESPEAQAVEPLVVQARDEILALLKDRENLKNALAQELKNRHEARQALEREIETTRRDELARRTGSGA